jgi:glycosyltransferase involved in cell wall biosynthesis
MPGADVDTPAGRLPAEAFDAVRRLGSADIVVGIPSYNNAGTIRHVVQAAEAGASKYFPQSRAVIINSDGGSTDATRDTVVGSGLDNTRLLFLSTPLFPVHRLSFPYHGIPGKGSAFRMIFRMATLLGAQACAVVDSDLRSITPEWIDLLLRPILRADFDFVAPYYHRHKYDGTITNSIVYPLTRALYGYRLRQPIGGEFGLSRRIMSRYLERRDWESDAARFGIDIWMTTIAMAEGFRICQSFLGAKLHDPKDPGAHLGTMLQQVVSSVFALMREYERVWRPRRGSEEVDLFGFRYGVGLDPVNVNTERMLRSFSSACEQLVEIWSLAMHGDSLAQVRALGTQVRRGARAIRMEDDLWARIIADFAVSYRDMPLERGSLLQSLIPLYLARVASFVEETRELTSGQVEERIERLCLCFERLKSYLLARWDGMPVPEPSVAHAAAEPEVVTARSGE